MYHRSIAPAAALLLAAAGAVVVSPARAAAQKARPVTPVAAVADTSPPSAAAKGAAAGKRRTKKAAAPARLTAKQRLAREMDAAAKQVRAALIIQDTATLAHWWADDYTYTAPSGETYSKWQRLEAVMSLGYVGEEQAEVLPSELDIVRRYGDVVVVSSRLGPPSAAAGSSATARSRAGRTQLLTVWVRDGNRWRTVASQATAVAGPPPLPPAKKKKR